MTQAEWRTDNCGEPASCKKPDSPRPSGKNSHTAGGNMQILICAICVICGLLLSGPFAEAWTGRRAVLHTEAQVMLALNEPWRKKDCSFQMQRLLNTTFPELRATCKWFKRTTVEIMATWPWDVVMSLKDLYFGDLIFADGDESRKRPSPHKLTHIMMKWIYPETAIHAGKTRGFSETNLKPYWWPRINLAIRPPY